MLNSVISCCIVDGMMSENGRLSNNVKHETKPWELSLIARYQYAMLLRRRYVMRFNAASLLDYAL